MRLKELIEKHDWQEVQSVLLSLYPDEDRNIKSYRSVFEKLKLKEAQNSSCEICLKEVEEEGNKYVHVNAIDLSEKVLGKVPIQYCLMYTQWQEWLGMSINSTSLKEFSEIEVIAHCLWEMTFCGFDENEIRKIEKHLDS